jgi:pimeloyl-ACP methyl ester carboxylesterase
VTIDHAVDAGARSFHASSGEIAAEVSGSKQGQLVIGIPGLSANLRSFDVIFGGLDPAKHRRLAFDPRGRGRSEKTPPGTYGWPSHVRDILEMADQLGAETFDLIGWSMGSWIAMKVAQMAPGRVRRIVLVDAVGTVDESVRIPIYAGLDRLGTVYPSREAFMTLVKSIGLYQPWSAWERLFDYELEDVAGGSRARTAKAAPLEDDEYRDTQDTHALWPAVTMPALLVRALNPIPPDYGYVLPVSEYTSFLAEVRSARGIEVDANHYTVGVHPDVVQAIAEFLGKDIAPERV